MEEVSSSTSWMKKVLIGVVALVVILGITFALFSSQQTDGECEQTEVVSPLDVDADSSPF